MEAEASSSTASSATTAQVPSSVSGNTEDEEANPPVCIIKFTGPIHQVNQPAYDIIRGLTCSLYLSLSGFFFFFFLIKVFIFVFRFFIHHFSTHT